MPSKKAQGVSTSLTVKTEDINTHSYADFRRKWTPTEFCNLPLSERTTVLVGLLTSFNPIFIVQVDGGYNFATQHTLIHGAMPMLYDFSTNKQIAREACGVFYRVGTSPSSVSVDWALTTRFTEQHVQSILSLAFPHNFRSDEHVDHR